jgi:UDP-glucose 4-epimerase
MTIDASHGNSFFSGRKILITGGAGLLAANLIKQLLVTECHILRLDLPGTAFIPVNGNAQVTDIAGDIRDRSVWREILNDVDVVFHFAAQTSVYKAEKDPLADLEINVVPMLYLLETCSERRIYPTIVFSGTVTEAGLTTSLPVNESEPDRPITVYDLHKWMSENYLLQYARCGKVRGVVLRLANVYGPGPKSSSADRGVLNLMVRRAIMGDPVTIYGEGDHLRDYTYIDDVAWAFLEAASQVDNVNGHHYVIGSGRGYTIAEAFNMVAELVGRRIGTQVPVLHVPPPPSQSPIESRDFVADSTRFMKATGWMARVPLGEGIHRTIEHYLFSEETL